MNLQQLEYIVALDIHRNHVKAAAHCHVTQPTLSMMVKKLEDELLEKKKEMEAMAKENEKLRKMVGKFKERWDTLREGARKRERSGTVGFGVKLGLQDDGSLWVSFVFIIFFCSQQ